MKAKLVKESLNELEIGTYQSAAEKLKRRGHKKRAAELEKYAQSKVPVDPNTITMYGNDKISLDDTDITVEFRKDAHDDLQSEYEDILNINLRSSNFNANKKYELEMMMGEPSNMIDKDIYFYNDYEEDIFEHPDAWIVQSEVKANNRKDALKLFKVIKNKVQAEKSKFSPEQQQIIDEFLKRLRVNDLYV